MAALAIIAIPADAGTVSGRVLNKATGQYLGNAVVVIAGTGKSAVTSANGGFTIREVPAGSATVSVTYTGLDTVEETVVVPEQGTVTRDFELSSRIYTEETVVLGEFMVSGEREGNAKAIVDQRQALNIKTVIAADAFGSVVEDNVGEFLKFLPGVSLDYVENDVRAVRVRGLAPKYASVLVDGNPVATSASSSINTGRTFEFEQMSLSTAEAIEVVKTPLADMPANSLAGTVNVRSKSALNQRGRRIKYSASFTLNEYEMSLSRTPGWDDRKHFKALPNYSFEFSDTFMDGKLGVVAAINHTGTYVEQNILIGTGKIFDRNPTNNETEVPGLTQWNFQDGLKPTWRDSVLLNLDYKATEDLTLSLRTSFNYYAAPFHNRNWIINANNTVTANPDGTLNYTGLTNLTHYTARSIATAANSTISSAQTGGSSLLKHGGTFVFNPAMVWNVNDNVTFDGSISYSRSYNEYDSGTEGHFSVVSARMNGVSWEYDRAPGSPAIHIRQLPGTTNDTRSLFDIVNYNSAVTANVETRDSEDQFWTGRGDVTIEFPDATLLSRLKFGADSRLQVRDIHNFNPQWTINTGAGGVNLAMFPDPYTNRSPDKGESITDLNGLVARQPSVDRWALYELFTTYNTNPLLTTTTAQQPFNANVGNNLRNLLQNHFDIKERIWSGYVLGTLQPSEKVQIVGGLRYESTETEGRSFDDLGHQRAVTASGTTNTNSSDYILARYQGRSTRTFSYDDLFPSVQVNFTPNENFVVRGAYYKSILRPPFNTVVGGVTVNDTATSFTVRNNELDPEYADNFDARVEYYFEPVGVISAGIFYKSLSDMHATVSDVLTAENMPQAIIDLGYDPNDLISGGATVSRVVNVASASIWGFELDYSQQLSFLPDPWGGLGVFANYTYTHPGDEDLFSLTGGGDGIPKNVFNAGVSYKQGRFNGQVKFNWVDQRLIGVTGISLSTAGVITPGTGNNSFRHDYRDDKLQVDLNLSYEMSRKAIFFLNISNVFNATDTRFYHNDRNLFRDGAFGAKYTIGVKGSF